MPVASRRGQASILIVEDHPPNLTALEAILEPLLEPLGERILRAGTAAEAVAIASAEDVALVLLDLQMPELDGFETVARLKKVDAARSVPIIIVTRTTPTRAEVVRGYASGAIDFVSRPIDADLLRSKVAAFLNLSRRHRRPDESSEPRMRARPEDESGRLSERLLSAAPAQDPVETLEAVIRIHNALTEDLDLGNITQRAVDETRAFTRARGGAFHYLARGAPCAAFSGAMREGLVSLGPESLFVKQVFDGVGVVRVGDIGTISAFGSPPEVRSLLAVPVVALSGRVEGALVLVDDRRNAFDARDEGLAVLAAKHAAAALENARLYDEAQEARDRAELAEVELRAGEARLRLALESGGLGTWDFNPTTGALRWDARARAIYGVLPDAVVTNETFFAAVHPEDRALVSEASARALDPTGDGTFELEYRVVRPIDRAVRWIAAKGQAIIEDGRTVRFIGTVLDSTARKRVEEERTGLLFREREARAEAESASRAKDEFLATVSHELRNPLNAILGWSRVLLEEDAEPDAERVKKGLEIIARNAKTQVHLVEDILEVSRIITGKLVLTTALVPLRAAIDAAVETVRSAAQAKGVMLETTFENAPTTIVADEDRLQQILWNLLSNAVKFTPRGGRVRLAAGHAGDDAVLAITDSGEGIERRFLPHVFERFRQADGSSTRRHGGLGLGLAIVRHLVELHGGTVHAESDGPGRGATFSVHLPIRGAFTGDEMPPPSTTRSLSRLSPTGGSMRLAGRRVVVLDDEEDMRDLIAMILENAGASVVRAKDVYDAIQAIEADPPNVAMSDLAMPQEDGYSFVRRVRSSARAEIRGLPVIAMTAYARAEDRHRVLDAGFDRHVPKPIEPAELVAAVAELLECHGRECE